LAFQHVQGAADDDEHGVRHDHWVFGVEAVGICSLRNPPCLSNSSDMGGFGGANGTA
jgi:hypothetical protein